MAALLDYTDLERQKNITLSDSDGRNLANAIANGLLAWSASYCNRAGWSKSTYTEAPRASGAPDTTAINRFSLRLVPALRRGGRSPGGGSS